MIKLQDHYNLEDLHKKLLENQENTVTPTLNAEILSKIASDAFFESKALKGTIEDAYRIANEKLKGVQNEE